MVSFMNPAMAMITAGQNIQEMRTLHMAVFPGRQGRNNRPVRAVIGGQQAS